MNLIKYSLTFLFLVFAIGIGQAQAVLLELTVKSARNYLTIDNAASNSKFNAVIIVTQSSGKPQPVGVWYRNNKWEIYHQNKKSFLVGTKFNVLILDPAKVKNAFVHTASSSNITNHITTINNALTNSKGENLAIFVTQRYEKTNPNPVGVWYNQNKWKIYNENRAAMPSGMKFNVLVMPKGKVSGLGSLTGESYFHTVSSANKSSNYTYLKTSNTATKLFVTQNWKGVRSAQLYSTAYNKLKKKWSIQTPVGTKMMDKFSYNVLALNPSLFIIRDPLTITKPTTTTTTKPTTTAAIINSVFSIDNNKKPTIINSKVNPLDRKTIIKDVVAKPTGLTIIPPYIKDLGTSSEPKEPESEETPEEAISLEAEGPNITLGKDLNTVLSTKNAEYFISKLNIYKDLYEDKNEHSGYFYYLPASYSLKWEQTSGKYSFYLQYLSKDGEEDKEDVFVAFELAPNIKKEDVEMAEYFLSKEMGKEVKLRPMILQAKPALTFQTLAAYGVENQSISTPTDFLQPIMVSWNMGSRVDDFTDVMMSGLGVNGEMVFEPYSENPRDISVPVRLKVNTEQTYGKLEYDKATSLLNGFKNPTDYPIVLDRIVMLRKKLGNYKIETIDLADYNVEPGKYFAEFSDAEANGMIEGPQIERLWLEYTIQDCYDCDQDVLQKLRGGVSDNLAKDLAIELITTKEDLGAKAMYIEIRSMQGSPKGDHMAKFPILEIEEDKSDYSTGKFYVPEGADFDYEYQITVVDEETDDIKISEWVKGVQSFLTLTKSSIDALFVVEEEEGD